VFKIRIITVITIRFQGLYTLWWRAEQFISAPLSNGGNIDELGGMLSWTGVVSDTASWHSALPLPAPYTFVYSSASCSFEENGVIEHGMKWGPAKELVSPAENQESPKTKEEVLSWFQEATSTSAKSSDSQKERSSEAIALAIIAIILSSIVISIIAGLFVLRITKPDLFAQALHPQLANHLSGGETTQKRDML
jgi:hypothetical protein